MYIARETCMTEDGIYMYCNVFALVLVLLKLGRYGGVQGQQSTSESATGRCGIDNLSIYCMKFADKYIVYASSV